MRGKHRRQWYLLMMNLVAEPGMVCDWMDLDELPDNYFFPCEEVKCNCDVCTFDADCRALDKRWKEATHRYERIKVARETMNAWK